MGPRQHLERWFQRIWVDQDRDAVDDLATHDAVFRGLEETTLSGRDEFKLYHRMILDLLDDFAIEIEQALEDGEWAAVRARLSCTYRRTGERHSTRLYAMAQFRDGLLVQGHNLIDAIEFFEQAGQLPPRTMDQLLLGQRPVFIPTFAGSTAS